MKPFISEFSYGYALTQELAGGILGSLVAAPIFPSLISEGRAGGGYDLQLPIQGRALFLQFKLSDCMINANAREWSFWKKQYYRMYLYSDSKSMQHQLLINLEKLDNDVFYAAPIFHKLEEMNDAYLQKKIFESTVFISPSEIGSLPDSRNHYIVFVPNDSSAYFCSKEPIKIMVNIGKRFVEECMYASKVRNSRIDAKYFRDLLKKLVYILSKAEVPYFNAEEIERHSSRFDASYLRFASSVAYISRAYLNAEFFIVGKRD